MPVDRSRLEDRTLQVVVGIALLGLLARLVFLGSRVSHFDEARVAWWGLEYLRSGATGYRFIIHGPLLQHVHRPLFAVFGATDAVARAPVALVGGLLPLVSLWFRHRLSDVEVVALALLLAFDPVLLYYSRFTRSTVLVAAFCLVAFAAFVRWVDGFGPRYLYVGAAALALGFAAKENAVVYVLCWLGAGALVVDAALFRPRRFESGRERVVDIATRRLEVYRTDPAATRRRVLRGGGHVLGAATVFLVVAFLLYAPRGGEAGLWSGAPLATLERTVADVVEGYEYWLGHREETTVATYRDRLGRFLATTLRYAGPLLVLSVVGFLRERYARVEQRHLVLFCAYWGFASVVGYPLGTDIWGPWIVVNALVPLAVPAAVGVAWFVDVGRAARTDDDLVSVATVVVLTCLVVLQVAVVGVGAVYLSPTSPDNDLVQFAQPQQEMTGAVDETLATAAGDGGPDVLFYGGDDFVTMDDTAVRTPACIEWFRTLPWAWYLDANDVSVTCAQTADQLPASLPPVIVAEADCRLPRTVECREVPEELVVDGDLEAHVPGSYDRHGFLHRTTGGADFDGMVVFVDSERG